MSHVARMTFRCLLILASVITASAASAAPDFQELDRAVAAGELGSIKTLLIVRDGELVFERYYRNTNAGTLHLVNSVTMSLGAT